MSVVTKAKADKRPTFVDDLLRFVRDQGPDGSAALEHTLQELALVDLHKHRSKLRAVGRKAVNAKRTETKKFARAVAKTYFQTQLDVPDLVFKQEYITIPYYERKDGTPVEEHRRRLPKGHSPKEKEEREEVAQELEDVREYQRRQEPRYGLDRLDGLADKTLKAAENETYNGAISAFLRETSIGAGIVSVARFLSDTGGKFQFAARAIAEFGPWAGTRVAFNYFRYGGYDLSISQVDGQLKTEFGDTVPKGGTLSKMREWALERLGKRLPSELSHQQSAEPPSEGFVLDRNGNVVAHAVGRGNDYFLPFSMRQLRQMRKMEGGEYVRRRMYGGPTVEDFHIAMMKGLDRITVISNSGTFTVELTSRAHGLKMEHMQILERFQDLIHRQGRLDFKAYNTILDTMHTEFPLHFRKPRTERGDWANEDDRIYPDKRFREGVTDLLSRLGGQEPESRDRSQSPYPWTRAGMTQQDWWNNTNMPTEQKIRTAWNAYGRAGDAPPKWLKDSYDKLTGVTGTSRTGLVGPSPTQRQGPPERASGPRPPSTQQRAAVVAPRESSLRQTGTVDWKAYDTGRDRIEALGYSPDSFDNTGAANRLARTLTNMNDNDFQRLMGGSLDETRRKLLDEVDEIFRLK